MTIPKSILYVFLYYLFIQLMGIWVWISPADGEIVSYAHVINSTVLFFVILLIFYVTNRKDVLKINKTKISFYVIGMILGLLFPYFQILLGVLYYLELPQSSILTKFDFSNLASLNVGASILLVPVSEELFFRNYIQERLRNKYANLTTIIWVSLLFALTHVQLGALFSDYIEFNFHQVYIAFFLGLISGMLYFKSNSVGPAIAMHSVANLVVYASL